MDCIDLDKLGVAASAPRWIAANDNECVMLPPARVARRAKLELLH